jgi:glucose-6-phosphate 1-dehydrogenase
LKELAKSVLIIFGATGDLSRRKILPALLGLERARLLPEGFRVLALSRKKIRADELLAGSFGEAQDAPGMEAMRRLGAILSVTEMDIGKPEEYSRLADSLARLEEEAGRPLRRLFYLAIPAGLFPLVVDRLALPDLNAAPGCERACRYLVEKPFGSDAESARALIERMSRSFREEQIFRIDHYLAKETAQNILAFRFENPLFERSWNRERISHIMVTAAESIGIEGRGDFYDGMGALRDVFQSHLLQLLALIAMDRPASYGEAGIHREKERLLSRVMPPDPERMARECVRGQYAGYREEAGRPDSMTETYAAVRLSIDSDAWRGVPVFLRCGKALREKVTEVNVVFPGAADSRRNMLTIRIQPDEGIAVDLKAKRPGFSALGDPDALEDVQLDFCYRDGILGYRPEAYERVLMDALRGDRSLFATSGEVLDCWRISQPIMEAWKSQAFPLHAYGKGSWGPEAADRLISPSGLLWPTETHRICPVRLPSSS